MILGNKIAELRKEKGMTQESLANALGVSNQAVSKWEANQSCPDIQLLPQLADFFGVTLDNLFGREVIQEDQVVTCENHMTGECIQIQAKEVSNLTWEDDEVLRVAVFIGHNMLLEQDCTKSNEITIEGNGATVDIICGSSVASNKIKMD